MKRQFKLFLTALALATLAACGGGDDLPTLPDDGRSGGGGGGVGGVGEIPINCKIKLADWDIADNQVKNALMAYAEFFVFFDKAHFGLHAYDNQLGLFEIYLFFKPEIDERIKVDAVVNRLVEDFDAKLAAKGWDDATKISAIVTKMMNLNEKIRFNPTSTDLLNQYLVEQTNFKAQREAFLTKFNAASAADKKEVVDASHRVLVASIIKDSIANVISASTSKEMNANIMEAAVKIYDETQLESNASYLLGPNKVLYERASFKGKTVNDLWQLFTNQGNAAGSTTILDKNTLLILQLVRQYRYTSDINILPNLNLKTMQDCFQGEDYLLPDIKLPEEDKRTVVKYVYRISNDGTLEFGKNDIVLITKD